MKYLIYRLLDKYIGSLLCFILTLFHQVRVSIFPYEKEAVKPKKILLTCFTEAGSWVCAYFAVKELQDRYPDAEIYAVASSVGKDILELYGVPEENVVTVDVLNKSFSQVIGRTLLAILKTWVIRPDVAINLEVFVRLPIIVSYLSGAKTQIGFHPFHQEGNYVGNLFSHRLIYSNFLHISASYLQLSKALAYPASEEPLLKDHQPMNFHDRYLFTPSEAERHAIINKLKQNIPNYTPNQKLILLNPNSSDRLIFPLRKWPDDHYLTCAKALLEDENNIIIFTGAPNERESLDELVSDLNHDRVVNFAGETTIRELMVLYTLSHVLITNDSGPAHFASLTELPMVVLYGPENPSIFGAMSPNATYIYKELSCSPCINVYNQKFSPCKDNQCLQTIDPQEVITKAKACINV